MQTESVTLRGLTGQHTTSCTGGEVPLLMLLSWVGAIWGVHVEPSIVWPSTYPLGEACDERRPTSN